MADDLGRQTINQSDTIRAMIHRLNTITGDYAYLISNSILEGRFLAGTPVLSGQITDEKAVLPFLEGLSESQVNHRDILVSGVYQKGTDDSPPVKWLKVRHEDVADVYEIMSGVQDPLSKITASTIYLANQDGDRFKDAVRSLNVDFQELTPRDPKTNAIKTVGASKINHYMPFREDKMLLSYYAGRQFVRESTGDPAQIKDINPRQRRTISFVTTVNGKEHAPNLPMDTFMERYNVVEEGNSNGRYHLDMERYRLLSDHKLTPDPTDDAYLRAVELKESQATTELGNSPY